MQDIDSIPKRELRRLETLFQDLNTKRDKWKQLQRMKKKHLDDEESAKKHQRIFPKIIDWWKADEKQPISEVGKEIVKSSANWWKRTSSRIQQTYSDIQEIIHAKPSGDTEENRTAAESSAGVHNLVRKGSLFRRDSLDPFVASSFDVAVVLLGLNDLKEAFMPNMRQGANSSFHEGTEPRGGALTIQLRSVFFSLEKVMGNMGTTKDQTDPTLSAKEAEKLSRSTVQLHPPLVVVPELPVAPLEVLYIRDDPTRERFLSKTLFTHPFHSSSSFLIPLLVGSSTRNRLFDSSRCAGFFCLCFELWKKTRNS